MKINFHKSKIVTINVERSSFKTFAEPNRGDFCGGGGNQIEQ